MSKPRFKPLALAVALALAGLGPTIVSSPLSAATVQENVTVTPSRSVSPREDAIISAAGVKVLRHIAQARGDIHSKDPESARTELDQAEQLLDIIQAALPTTEVKDRIWVAKKHMEYEDTQDVLPELIPIYASLDDLVDIMPLDGAKQHLDEAREHLKSGDKEKAKAALEATDAALQYTEVELPLNTTRQFVVAAKADLSKDNTQDADRALKAAEDSVVYLSFAVEQPLFAAKALLWQTALDLGAGQNDLAKADLRDAIGYLKTASESDQKPTQEAASELLGQARQLQQDLDAGQDISTRLRSLWERTHALADRSLEYLAADWAQYRAESPIKSDLIEAKLHVANARIDRFTGHEEVRAAEELNAAGRFLAQAVEQTATHQTEAGYQERIAKLQKSVNDLKADTEVAAESKYTAIEEALRGMIQSL
jgi:hypothetical protein